MKFSKKLIATLFIAVFAVTLFTGCGVDIEASAKPVVEEIMANEYGHKFTCKSITNITEVSDNKYTAKALVSSEGRSAYLDIEVEVVDDNVIVEVDLDSAVDVD